MNIGKWLVLSVAAAAVAGGAPVGVLILGDSLTAGYGVEKEEAYPSLLQKRLGADSVNIINAGISGNTTAGGLRRLKWALRSNPQILVIALGGNDGLRGLNPDASRANLEAIIDDARKAAPTIQIVLAGMKSPPNMGEAYTAPFEGIFSSVAKSRTVTFLPFLLEGVAGEPGLNQADGIHPNAKGHEAIATLLMPIIADLAEKLRQKGKP